MSALAARVGPFVRFQSVCKQVSVHGTDFFQKGIPCIQFLRVYLSELSMLTREQFLQIVIAHACALASSCCLSLCSQSSMAVPNGYMPAGPCMSHHYICTCCMRAWHLLKMFPVDSECRFEEAAYALQN